MFTFIAEGTVYAGNGFVLTTADPITLGTTSLAFTQFSGAGEIIAGAGIAKSGNTLSVATGGITNAMLAGSIAASKLVGADIATVGTITAGTWTATTIGVLYGGTGVTTSTGSGNNVLSASPTFTGTVNVAALTASSTITAPVGAVGTPSLTFAGNTNYGIFFDASWGVVVTHNGTGTLGTRTNRLVIPSAASLVWTSGAYTGTIDSGLSRSSAGLAIR
jgi:hypothetical protein